MYGLWDAVESCLGAVEDPHRTLHLVRGVVTALLVLAWATWAIVRESATSQRDLEARVEERTTELARLERQTRSLLDHLPVIAWEFTPGTGHYRTVGRRAEQMLAWPLDTLLDFRFFASQIHEEDRTEVIERLQRIAREGGADEIEFRFHTGDGRILWLHSAARSDPEGDGTVVRGVTTDLTTRKQAELALQRSEASFRALVEGLPDALVIHVGGTILYANRAAASLLRYDDPAELAGLGVDAFLGPGELPIARARLEAADRGEPLPPREYAWIRKDGSTVYGESLAIRAQLDGHPVSITVIRDSTERRRLQSQLVVADRMVSVGTLAAGVAHEINNPLAYVISNVQFALASLEARDEPALADVRTALQDAAKGGERVRQIVRDLRTFSRNDEGETPVPVDVGEVLAASVGMARNILRPRAELEQELGPVPRVMGSEARLGQIFLNLLVNAAHSIPEGDPAAHRVRVVTRTGPDGQAVIEIHDSGCGIAAAIRERIFDPFFTTKPTGMGTGLGLAICRNIVRQLGGTVSFTSEPGRGTTFTVELPPAAPEAATPAPERPAPAAPQVTRRILVVDDEPLVCNAIARTLGREHFVQVAHDGREALEILQGTPFDLVLCDLMMPDLTGMDVHAALAESRPALLPRIAFLTGGAFTDRGRSFVQETGAPVLEKPFTTAGLQAFVRERIAAVEGAQAA